MTALLSALVGYFSPYPPLSEAKYCHGTNFSTLHLMCTYDEGTLVPFAHLKRPPLGGELSRGIRDSLSKTISAHQIGTSWAAITFAAEAIGYSEKFKFDPTKIKAELQEHIDWHRDSKKTGWAPNGVTIMANHALWNRVKILIQQFRAWNEEEFERDLSSGLKEWMLDAIAYLDSHEERCHCMEHEGMGISGLEMRTLIRAKMVTIQETLSEKPFFQIDDRTKEILKDGPPIVFLTSEYPDESISTDQLFKRPMKLGENIQWIATTDVPYVTHYLEMAKLSKKVSVISMDALAAMDKH